MAGLRRAQAQGLKQFLSVFLELGTPWRGKPKEGPTQNAAPDHYFDTFRIMCHLNLVCFGFTWIYVPTCETCAGYFEVPLEGSP